MTTDLQVSRDIAAPAERVWALVSDLPRMGEWSDENTGGAWVGDDVDAAPGARFKGSNRNGIHRWSTTVTVDEAEPGRCFAFSVSYMGIPISRWAYELEPSADGCTVTERWVDRRPGWFRPLARVATGVGDRAAHTRASMATTLDRLAVAAEIDPG